MLAIPAGAIDHDRARGLVAAGPAEHPHAAGWRTLLRHRPFVVLAASLALFHFANAPILLLLGQRLELAYPGSVTLLMSAAIITAQLVSIPVALLVGARADRWGRKPLLLAGFAALPLRALLFALTDHPAWVIAGQVLDGVSLGTLDALLALVLADIMRGSGRYNAARGVIGTVQGIGGSTSNLVAGLLVVAAGYPAAFLTLAAVAAGGTLLVLRALPETAAGARGRRPVERQPHLERMSRPACVAPRLGRSISGSNTAATRYSVEGKGCDASSRSCSATTRRSAQPAARHDDAHVAAAALMVEAARLDGSFTDVERDRIRASWSSASSSPPGSPAELLARAERTATESVAWQGFTQAIKDGLAPEERIGVIEMLWEVVYADGQLHDYEASLLRRVDRPALRQRPRQRRGAAAGDGKAGDSPLSRRRAAPLTAAPRWLYAAATSGGGLRRTLGSSCFQPVPGSPCTQ